MFLSDLPIRGQDSWGSGEYGAPRSKSDRSGQKKSYGHNGEDRACYPNTVITTHVSGDCTKHGYAYANDLSIRYVEITDTDGLRHRFFYVKPSVNVGDFIKVGSAIGKSQRLGDRYEGITEHCHYEVKDKKGNYLVPSTFLVRP